MAVSTEPQAGSSNPPIPNVTTEQMSQFNDLLAAFGASAHQRSQARKCSIKRQGVAQWVFADKLSTVFSLTDILSFEAIGPLLDEEPNLAAELASYLPSGIEPTSENVRRIVNSPDFRHGVRSLDVALRRAGDEGLRMFFLHGLGLESGWEGVEEYVEAVERAGSGGTRK